MSGTSARTGFSIAAPVVLCAALWSCAPPPDHLNLAPGRTSTVLFEPQIQSTNATTAYEAIVRLKPNALHAPGGRRFEPTVYLDGLRMGGLSELTRIPAMGIVRIQFLNSVEAFSLYGQDQKNGGAIVITSQIGQVTSSH
jgi:hypothetical protein